MVTLETVEIPGLREAVQKEARIRDAAFLDGNEILCGVEIIPLSLRRLIVLEQSHNGFVVPWEWESDAETFAHAVHFLYVLRPGYRPPTSPRESFWLSFKNGMKEGVFSNRIARRGRKEVIGEIAEWLKDVFMDSPKGGGNGGPRPPSYASYPVYIFDLLAEAGLTFTYQEIMDMPLPRLWQFWRVADRRVNGAKLTNPSDEISVAHLAKGAA